jgi:uncharacterized protein YndB with AHSA1/START domain
MLRESERGCLVLADISGYTGFLADSELEHAQDVLRDLIQTVVGKLRGSFRLAKLEGDAAFCYVVTDRLDGSQLLDTLEAAYFAFRARLDAVRRATTCECNACVLIPNLNLKFVAHHGSFVRERLFGNEELTGTDVIIVHRLLKNRAAEDLGVRAYILLTEDCLRAASLHPEPLGLLEHRESFADVGEVLCWVHDLERSWAREQELRRVRVADRDTFAQLEGDVPALPEQVWAYVTDPARRPEFVPGVVRVDEATRDGRRGVGTRNHCVHGEGASLEEVLDWRPHEYFTIRSVAPGLATWVAMEELTPTEGGTHLTIRLQRPRAAKDRAALEKNREMILGLYQFGLDHVREEFSRQEEPAGIG